MSAGKNILVYIKTKEMETFKPLSSLSNFTIASGLMEAVLVPYEKLEAMKEWCDSFEELCIKKEVKIELRHYKGKSIYSVG